MDIYKNGASAQEFITSLSFFSYKFFIGLLWVWSYLSTVQVKSLDTFLFICYNNIEDTRTIKEDIPTYPPGRSLNGLHDEPPGTVLQQSWRSSQRSRALLDFFEIHHVKWLWTRWSWRFLDMWPITTCLQNSSPTVLKKVPALEELKKVLSTWWLLWGPTHPESSIPDMFLLKCSILNRT